MVSTSLSSRSCQQSRWIVSRVNDKEVIAEEALLVVTDEVGFQHLLAALRARRDERHGQRVACLGASWRAEWIAQPRDRTHDAFPSPGGARTRGSDPREDTIHSCREPPATCDPPAHPTIQRAANAPEHRGQPATRC